MTALSHHEVKRSLIKRVFNFTTQNTLGGLVSEFGKRTLWMRTPVEVRDTPNSVHKLQIFLRAIDCEPLHEDLTEFLAFLNANKCQPQAVRALNVIEERSGREQCWRDKPTL